MCWPKKYGGLGFRRVREFNIAMLGKQVWRIMTDPHSLVCRLLKARYFSAVTFGEAVLGNNPGYIWRSLLEARELVVSGSRVKVGSGTSINVWNDPWIPDAVNAKISTPLIPELQHISVNNLLNENGKWDVEVLRDIFSEQDVNRILRIPRCSSMREDQWCWLDDEKGVYTVKTGYKRLMGVPNQTLISQDSFNWKKLWNMLIPPKVKNFIWRVLFNCLPTLDNMQKRHMEVNSQCPVCQAGDECLDHILWGCSFSRRCWEKAGLNTGDLDGQVSVQILTKVFDSWANRESELLCMIAWCLWAHRNAVVWRKVFRTAHQVVSSAKDCWFQWKEAQVSNYAGGRVRWEGASRWQRPQQGWFSCNVDVAISSERKVSSFGCLLRNENGEFVAG